MPLPNSTIGGFATPAPRTQGAGGFGGGDRSLASILDNNFAPEFNRLNEGLPGIEDLLTDRIQGPVDLNQFAPALEQFAGGLSAQMFGAGGSVEQATRGALGQSVQSGFGPASGGFENAKLHILKGATGEFQNALAGQAVNLAQLASTQRSQDISALLGFTQNQGARRDSAAESLFGGQATIDQAGRDDETMALNRRLIENALANGGDPNSIGSRATNALSGAAGGFVAGNMVVPGVGGFIGAGIGGLAGLFG